MTSRVKQLVWKILLLKEEFSVKEIYEAVAVLRNSGTQFHLVEYLAEGQYRKNTSEKVEQRSKP